MHTLGFTLFLTRGDKPVKMLKDYFVSFLFSGCIFLQQMLKRSIWLTLNCSNVVISAPIWTESLVDVKVSHFPVCFPPWYLPSSVTCVLLSAPSLMCCTCVANYRPCSCVFKSMRFTLSCLLLALFFSLVFHHPSSFSTFFSDHYTCLLFCEKKNITAFKGPSRTCLRPPLSSRWGTAHAAHLQSA